MSYNEDNLVNLGHLKRVAQIAHDYRLIIPTLTVSNTELTITEDHSNTITFTTDSDGVITITSDDDTIATVTINNGTITVNALAVGNTTLTLSIAPTATYRAISETINVVVAAKPVPELTLSDTDIEVREDANYTVTVTTNSTGAISASSSDDTYATVSSSGNTITITGVAAGSTTVIVSIAETASYAARSATIDVTVAEKPADLEGFSWSEIAAIGAQGTGDNYWDIGDTKSLTLNGTVGTLALSNYACKVFIIDFNYKGTNGVYFQGFKNANGVDIALCDSKYGSSFVDGTKYFNMNHWGNYNYGGWKGCDLRYDILGSTNIAPSDYGAAKTTSCVGYDASSEAKTIPVANTLMAALPASLKTELEPWTVYSDNTGYQSTVPANVTTSVDYLPLLSEFEVFGVRKNANRYEQNQQAQMAYYANGNSMIKYKNNDTTTACACWVRSAYCGNRSSFGIVSTNGGSTVFAAPRSWGLAPAFRLA